MWCIEKPIRGLLPTEAGLSKVVLHHTSILALWLTDDNVPKPNVCSRGRDTSSDADHETKQNGREDVSHFSRHSSG
jgi:hypothetical protein